MKHDNSNIAESSMLLFVALGLTTGSAIATPKFCSQTAGLVYASCMAEAKEEFRIGKATCTNIGDLDERKDCYAEAMEEIVDSQTLCAEQHLARKDLCGAVGEGRYDPDFDPENFVDPLEIGTTVTANPYFPLIVGYEWVYEGSFDDEGEEVTETIRVTVTDETKLIEGVTCLVVNDVVSEEGELIEDTDDWYAQDVAGNVWYCGEIAKNYETNDGDEPGDPELVDIEGSWKTGRDGAKPGILIHAQPMVGETYRQEVLLGEAEDVAEVVDLAGTESVPGGACSGNCLVTKEYTPIEPGEFEHKYYVPGIGMLLEVNGEGDRVELIEFNTP